LCRDDDRWQNQAQPTPAQARFLPRQNNLAVALREVGRIERTLFIIEWILDTDMQRRAQIGLNKERPTMRSKMRSVSGGRGKFAIARQRGSTTESLGSIY
jgi:TnpA family transposase